MSGLEAIKARAKAYAEHGTPGLRAPQDRAELLRLLDESEAAMLDIRARTAELIADGMQSWAGASERSYVQGFAEAAWGEVAR